MFNNTVFSAPKNSLRSSRTRSASVKNISGTLDRNNFTGSVSNVYSMQDSNAMVCGVAPSSTNAVAKRVCAYAMADALKVYCKSYPCSDVLKVKFSFDFELPTLSNIFADVNGTACNGKKLNTFCLPFQEELLDGLWDLYSEKSIRERKNCNMAMAKYAVAQDCFQYIQSEKNQSVDGVFNSSKISGLDKGIDEKCGREAILKKYKAIALDDLDDSDMNTYFGMAKYEGGVVSFSSDNFQGKKKLSSTVASLFANVGDNTWNIMGQVGKLADLRLNMKSSTYPRELVVIANTFVTDGETACGKSFAADMENTSFNLLDNRSALELAISKKGVLKGTFDFVLDNTVGIVAENKSEDIKKKGIVGKVKETVEKNKEKKATRNVYPDADSDAKILASCKEDVDVVTKNVKNVLNNISNAISEIEKTDEKYRDTLLQNNQKIVSNLRKILEYDRNDDKKIELSSNPTLIELRKVVSSLSSVEKFNCAGKGFENREDITYKFSFNSSSGDVIGSRIGALEVSRKNISDDLGKRKDLNPVNYDEMESKIKPIFDIPEPKK